MDIMYINSDPILHIVDEGTKFSAAQFLSSISTDSIWKAILQCWSSIYTGLPNRALVDQGSQFGKVFLDVAALLDIKVDSTGIEAHSSLGIGEPYHQHLRQTFRKIMADHKKTDRDLALALAVKAMNDTLGPEGLVPSVLVFGQYPKFNIPSSKPSAKTTQISRKMVAETARKQNGETHGQNEDQQSPKTCGSYSCEPFI